MEFNLLDIQEPLVAELKKLSKPVFNLDEIISVAADLKYTKEIKRILNGQLNSPSEEFVRLFACPLYPGKLTQSVREQFTLITKRAFAQFINERINERLRSAMTDQPSSLLVGTELPLEPELSSSKDPEAGIITTGEELEGYYIVKAILRDIIDPSRVIYRDKLSYFTILLDNNNRKPICRLYFDRKQKYVGFCDVPKKEEKIRIDNLDDIYKFAERLKNAVAIHENEPRNNG